MNTLANSPALSRPFICISLGVLPEKTDIGISPWRLMPASSPCSTCMREFNDGSRAEYRLCPGLELATPTAATCQKCGHAWSDHR